MANQSGNEMTMLLGGRHDQSAGDPMPFRFRWPGILPPGCPKPVALT